MRIIISILLSNHWGYWCSRGTYVLRGAALVIQTENNTQSTAGYSWTAPVFRNLQL
jgi:hypothetical protein